MKLWNQNPQRWEGLFSQSPAGKSAFQHEVRPGGVWRGLEGMIGEIREFLLYL